MAKIKNKSITLLVLIIAGETIFLLPFVLPRIYRPTVLDYFEITNTQLGSYFSIYGIIAMISYLLGGQLADRIPSRILMALALFLTAIGGFILILIPSSGIIHFVYGFWGFSTIFLFWAGMIRATREWGGLLLQGRAFGWLEGGRGLVAAVIGTLTWIVFAGLSSSELVTGSNPGTLPYRVILIITSIFTLIIGLLILKVIPDNNLLLTKDPFVKVLRNISSLMRKPSIWLLSIIIICAYSAYKITDDFSLYAKEVIGYSDVGASAVGTSALWLRGISAVLVGLFADRTSKVGLMILSFSITLVGSLLLGLGFLEWSQVLILLNLLALAIGIYAIRALYFAVQREASIPLALTGTAVGIMSFVGYTPDVYMGPLMGKLLDNNPGVSGHSYVFLVLAGFSLLGFIASLLFRYFSRTNSRISADS